MFKRLRSFIKRSPKKRAVAGTLAAILITGIAPFVYAGYGPSDPSVRPTYDWNKYNSSLSCTDAANDFGRCGSMNGPVFDSFINTPAYGDEENFNQIAPVEAGQSPTTENFSETTDATAGQTYWVRTYVHNDANQNLNCAPAHDDAATDDCTQVDPGSPSIATNTRVRVAVGQGVGNNVDVMTYISADNANPGEVWDSSTLSNSNQQFSVSYVPGSAVIYNNANPNGLALSDNINSSNGTQIGYQQMDGNLPGCFNYSAYVYLQVKVNSPALTVQKQVRMNTSSQWASSVNAKTGDTEEWRILYTNTGSANDNDVTISDQIPQGLTLVPNSVKWYDANNNGVVQKDSALAGGIDFGNYAPVSAGQNSGEVEFYTTVNKTVPTCTLTNTAYGWAQGVPKSSSSASVDVSDCQAPAYSCDGLTANIPEDSREVTLSNFAFTAKNGATFKDVVINWGDGSAPLTTNESQIAPYTYAADGTYTVTATAFFTVNGSQVSATGPQCTATVTAATTPTPPSTPSTPTSLPNTGMNLTEIIAAVLAVSTLTTAAHYVLTTRRLAKELRR